MGAFGLVGDEVGDIFGGVSTPSFGPMLPLLEFGFLVVDLESINPVVSSFSALTMVIVSWISLKKSVKLIKC